MRSTSGRARRPSAAAFFAKCQPVVGTGAVLFYLHGSGDYFRVGSLVWLYPAFGERNRGKERGIKNTFLQLKKKIDLEYVPCGLEAGAAGLGFSALPLPADGEPATVTAVTEPQCDSPESFLHLTQVT